MYNVYGLFSSETNELRYVGITSRSIELRKKEHLRNAINKKREDFKCPNYCWIRYELERNNTINVLLLKNVATVKEAQDIEQNLILLLGRRISNNGNLMNTTEGGEHTSYSSIYLGKLSKHSKAITQFDYKGDIVGEYDSILEAAFKNDLWDSHISQCCRGRRSRCGRFVWRYKGDAFDKFPIGNGLRRVVMYSKDKEFIKIFESTMDAAKEVGLRSEANLSSACKGRQVTFGGYFWRYEGDEI